MTSKKIRGESNARVYNPSGELYRAFDSQIHTPIAVPVRDSAINIHDESFCQAHSMVPVSNLTSHLAHSSRVFRTSMSFDQSLTQRLVPLILLRY